MRSRKARWLLALLALRPGEPVDRAWAAGLLWPDTDQTVALTNLRPVVSELRRAMGNHAYRLQTPDRRTVRLDLGGASFDLVEFEAALEREDFERAATLYRGALLEDCREEWVPQERAMREHQALYALQRLAEDAASMGDAEATVRHCRRAVTVAPHADAPRRRLMEALFQAGDLNSALQVYRDFAQLLRSEVGGLPDTETTDLYIRLRQDAAKGRMERPRRNASTKGNLPHPLAELVGREDERFELTEHLGKDRLVTLVGFGGIGKTRLATEVARDLSTHFEGGAWFAALETIQDGMLIPNAIATILSVKEVPGRSTIETLVERLRPHSTLLLLDNCEHVLEEAAKLCETLLRECGGLTILATSREPLGLPGERIWRATPLSVPIPDHLPYHPATLIRVMESFESVRLFTERARAADASFRIAPDNALDVATICTRLEGIPLAIELTAPHLQAMTVGQIARRLEDPLEFLSRRSSASVSRQGTLRATVDWSYGLLDEAQRDLLKRVSWFVGGWTLEAAEAIGGGEGLRSEEISSLLTDLVRRSLVEFQKPLGRYRLLEPVRQYALAKASVSDAYRRRFIEFYGRSAEAASQEGGHNVDQTWWNAEVGNVRQALGWAEESPEEIDWALRIARVYGEVDFVQGRFKEGLVRHQRVLALAGSTESRYRMDALTAASHLGYASGSYSLALAMQIEAHEYYRAAGDRQGIARSARAIGDAHDGAGRSQIALEFYKECHRLHVELGQERDAAIAAVRLGGCLDPSGPVEEALLWLDQARAYFERTGEELGVAWTFNGIGNAYLDRGDAARALLAYERALAIDEAHRHFRMAYTLDNLAKAAAHAGRFDEAHEHLDRGLTLVRENHDHRCLIGLTRSRGEVDLVQGRYDRSIRACVECLRLVDPDDAAFDALYAFEILGSALIKIGESTLGVKLVGAAESLRERLQIDRHTFDLLPVESRLLEARTELAADVFDEAWRSGRSLTMREAHAFATGLDRLDFHPYAPP